MGLDRWIELSKKWDQEHPRLTFNIESFIYECDDIQLDNRSLINWSANNAARHIHPEFLKILHIEKTIILDEYQHWLDLAVNVGYDEVATFIYLKMSTINNPKEIVEQLLEKSCVQSVLFIIEENEFTIPELTRFFLKACSYGLIEIVGYYLIRHRSIYDFKKKKGYQLAKQNYHLNITKILSRK